MSTFWKTHIIGKYAWSIFEKFRTKVKWGFKHKSINRRTLSSADYFFHHDRGFCKFKISAKEKAAAAGKKNVSCVVVIMK